MATATLMAFLNQLFSLSFAREDAYSSVGSPSDSRKIAGAKEPATSPIKALRDSFSLSCLQASPKSVSPSAVRKLHVKSSASIGAGVIHLVPLENSSTAILIAASAFSPDIFRISGITSSMAELSVPIFEPSILPEASTTKKSVIVLRETSTAPSYIFAICKNLLIRSSQRSLENESVLFWLQPSLRF